MHPAHRHFGRLRALAILAAGLACANIVHATEADSERFEARGLDSDWLAMSDDRLDNLRGGFDTDAGLKISIGIQRAVYIDGNLVTTTSLNIPDLGKVSAAQADALRASAGTVNVIRNGAGNTFEPAAIASSAIATVVQNTLDNQNIKSLTVIDATANSLGMLKTMNFQSGLRDALNTAAGGK